MNEILYILSYHKPIHASEWIHEYALYNIKNKIIDCYEWDELDAKEYYDELLNEHTSYSAYNEKQLDDKVIYIKQ